MGFSLADIEVSPARAKGADLHHQGPNADNGKIV